MTYLEKYKQDHPNGSVDMEEMCPTHFGYELPFCANPANKNELSATCEACWNQQIPGTEEKPHILDSGERRQFETGAVRDIQEGKGRCDLMPLEVVAKILNGDSLYNPDLVVGKIALFKNSDYQETTHLYGALFHFAESWPNRLLDMTGTFADIFLEVAKHFEEGAKKYGENNWQKGIPVKHYIDSAVRHYLKWRRGDKDEPHDRAFVWNLLCCIWEVDFSPRAKMEGMSVAEEAPAPEVNSGRFYICNREPCEKCNSDCHCTEYIGDAAVLEVSTDYVRYEDCPIGLFMCDSDGVFLKTEIVNAETGLNTAVHIGLGLSRKFEAGDLVSPIKYPFKERERV